ncbi:hypothetical protein DMENIID0001_016490 [Sergentomyia squamirostris]
MLVSTSQEHSDSDSLDTVDVPLSSVSRRQLSIRSTVFIKTPSPRESLCDQDNFIGDNGHQLSTDPLENDFKLKRQHSDDESYGETLTYVSGDRQTEQNSESIINPIRRSNTCPISGTQTKQRGSGGFPESTRIGNSSRSHVINNIESERERYCESLNAAIPERSGPQTRAEAFGLYVATTLKELNPIQQQRIISSISNIINTVLTEHFIEDANST